MKKTLSLFLLLFLFLSCNNSGNAGSKNTSDNNTKTDKTNSDSLMEEVMEYHNIGMAKMSKIRDAQKRMQLAIDSIRRLPSNLQKTYTGFKMQLDSALAKLSQANNAMDKWMEEFNMDSAKNNEDKRIEYLKSEKIKISKVKDAMLSSLKSADSLLKK